VITCRINPTERLCDPQPEYRDRAAGKLVRDAWLKSNGRTVAAPNKRITGRMSAGRGTPVGARGW
jgi:hypothetical protein